MFLRHAAFGGAFALTAVSAFRLGGAVLPWPSALAYATGLALAWGWIVVLRRTPSLLSIAASLDRTLHLDDSVVAALQPDGESSPVRPLVVRQALARTHGVTASVVFPLAFTRPALSLAGGLVAVVISVVPGAPPAASQRIAEGRALEGAGGSATAPGNRRVNESTEPDGTIEGANATAAASTSDRVGDDNVRLPVAESEATSNASQPRAATDPAAVPAVGGAPARTNDSRGAASGSAAGRADARSIAGLGSGAGADGAARGGGGNALGRGSGSGGVAEGRLLDGTTRRSSNAGVQVRVSGAAQREVAGGPSASYDTVAPELRPYVRAYFGAIRGGRE
jgi:hypothetical protein